MSEHDRLPCTMIYLARRNPRLSPEAFPQAWREHSALGKSCRNVQDKVLGVAQCSRVLEWVPPGATAAYDGLNLLRLRDLQAATDIWNDPETLAIMRPDEPRVFDGYVRDFSLVCREAVLRDGPRGGVLLGGFVRRRAGLSAEHFRAAWLGAADAPGTWLQGSLTGAAVRAVHHAVVAPQPPGYDYDGIVEWWFDGAPVLQSTLAAAADLRECLPAPYAEVADPQRSVFMLCRVTHARP